MNKYIVVVIISIVLFVLPFDITAQCYGIRDKKSGEVIFPKSKSECKTKKECQNEFDKWIESCSHSNRNSYQSHILNSRFGGGNSGLSSGLIKACEDNYKNRYEIILIGGNENGSTSSYSSNEFDELRNSYHTLIDLTTQKGQKNQEYINNNPQYTRSSAEQVGNKPPETTINRKRPPTQKTTIEREYPTTINNYKCNYAQIVSKEKLKLDAIDFIAQWLERADWFSLVPQISLNDYTQDIYDRAMRNGCDNRAEDYALYCEKFRSFVLWLSDTIHKKYCRFIPDVDMPALSNSVYQKNYDAPVGWKRIVNYDHYSGFFAALYRNVYDTSLFVLAFRGTDGLFSKDAIVDAVQAFIGIGDLQYSQAQSTIQSVLRDYIRPRKKLGAKLYLTGHSLGGGLASFAHASVQDDSQIVATYTYNAAGINRNKLALNNIPLPQKNIYALFSRGEILITSSHNALNYSPALNFSTGIGTNKLVILGERKTIEAESWHPIKPIADYYDATQGLKASDRYFTVSCIRRYINSLLDEARNSSCQYEEFTTKNYSGKSNPVFYKEIDDKQESTLGKILSKIGMKKIENTVESYIDDRSTIDPRVKIAKTIIQSNTELSEDIFSYMSNSMQTVLNGNNPQSQIKKFEEIQIKYMNQLSSSVSPVGSQYIDYLNKVNHHKK